VLEAEVSAAYIPRLLGLELPTSARDRDAGIAHVQLVAAGGMAGGAKAIDSHRGLFLKTPDDSHGIYGSLVMAAKVMKLESKAG